MKSKVLKLLFLIIFSYFNSQQKKINEIPQSDFMLINLAHIDCCVAWSNTEPSKLIYSDMSRNIYQIDVENLNFINVQEKLWVADYLTDSTKVSPVKLLYEFDNYVANSMFSKKDSYIAYKTYDNNFESKSIHFINTKTFRIEREIKKDIENYDFLTDEDFIFVENDEISVYNIIKDKILYTKKMKYKVNAINVVDENNIFIVSENNSYLYNLKSDIYKKVYNKPIKGNPKYINQKIYGTFDEGVSKYYDTITDRLEAISFPYCYEPVVDKEEKYIAMIKEGDGILIKKAK